MIKYNGSGGSNYTGSGSFSNGEVTIISASQTIGGGTGYSTSPGMNDSMGYEHRAGLAGSAKITVAGN